MENILYITYVDYDEGAFPGVQIKIDDEIKVMTAAGYHVDRIHQYGNAAQLVDTVTGACQTFHTPVLRRFSLLKAVKAALAQCRYQAAYIRFQFFSEDVRQITAVLEKNGTKVLMEFPTFPYEGELHRQGAKGEVKLLCDRMYRHVCARHIRAFVTQAEETQIYGLPCVRFPNGLDYSRHPLRHVRPPRPDEVHMLAVACMLPWHGYDRLLEGMGRYYAGGGEVNFVFHLVGEGREIGKYRQIVEKYALEDHVVFHGMQGGEKLNAIADGCDLAVGSLASFRVGLKKVSTLKSREYCAWGFPSINASPTDILDADDPTCLFVPEEEAPVDMEAVAAFYQRVYFESGRSAAEIAAAIREKAESRSDMQVVFQPVLEALR